MTLAVEGYGSFIQLSTDGGNTYTQYGEIIKIGLPGINGKVIEASHMASPSGWDEFIPGMVDAGELTVELNFTKAQFNSFISLFRSTNMFAKLGFSTGSLLVGACLMQKLGSEVPLKDRITATIGVKWTGKPVFTQ